MPQILGPLLIFGAVEANDTTKAWLVACQKQFSRLKLAWLWVRGAPQNFSGAPSSQPCHFWSQK